jgi:hypothetical protein
MSIWAKHRERPRFRLGAPPDGAAAEDLRNFVRREARAMNDRLDPRIARRDVLRVLAIGAAAATTNACAPGEATDFPDQRKARYQADSPEVQTFYRVNRYPAK